MSSAVAAAGSAAAATAAAAAAAAATAAAVLALSAALCLRKQGEALVLLAAVVLATVVLPGNEVKRGLPSASRVSRKARPVTFLPTLPLPCLFLQRTCNIRVCSEAARNTHVQ
jgi:hypothetical protein